MAMSPSEIIAFNQAVSLFNNGQKEQAHQELNRLYNSNPNNQQDLNLLLWLAFTAPHLAMAEAAIEGAIKLAPGNSNVISAQKWLATEKAKLPSAPSPAPLLTVGAVNQVQTAILPSTTAPASISNQAVPTTAIAMASTKALLEFQGEFARYCTDGIITQQEWASLSWNAAANELDLAEALAFIRDDALRFITRSIDQATEDGFVSYEEERSIRHLLRLLAIPPVVAAPLEARLGWLITFTRIRQGEFIPITASLSLEPEEIAYFEILATLIPLSLSTSAVPRKKGTTEEASRLVSARRELAPSSPIAPTPQGPALMVATNRRLIFHNNSVLPYSQIAYFKVEQGRVELQIAGSSERFHLLVNDPAMVKAALVVIARVSRQAAFESNPTRYPEGHLPSPIESSFFKVWEEYSSQQVQKIELSPEYEVFRGRYRVDFAHLPTKTAIELDGFNAHSNTTQIAKDRKREREIREAGWEFLRFGGQEIKRDVAGCVAEVYHKIARSLARSQGVSTPAPERVDYRPERVKTLFVEEGMLFLGKSFYAGNSSLFYKTQEAFSRAYQTSWEGGPHFLEFFKENGNYMLALIGEHNPEIPNEERERECRLGVVLLARRLATYRPQRVVIIGGIKLFVEKAVSEAGLTSLTKITSLPYPGKESAEFYIERLVKTLMVKSREGR